MTHRKSAKCRGVCRCSKATPKPPEPHTEQSWRSAALVYVDALMPEQKQRARDEVAQADWTSSHPFDFVFVDAWLASVQERGELEESQAVSKAGVAASLVARKGKGPYDM